MRKVLGVALVLGALAIPASAQAIDPYIGAPVSDNASQSACFGQARAAWSLAFREGGAFDTGAPGASEQGRTLSSRAGTNPENNAGYIEQYC